MFDKRYIVVRKQPLWITKECYIENVMSQYFIGRPAAMRWMLERGLTKDCKVVEAYAPKLIWAKK